MAAGSVDNFLYPLDFRRCLLADRRLAAEDYPINLMVQHLFAVRPGEDVIPTQQRFDGKEMNRSANVPQVIQRICIHEFIGDRYSNPAVVRKRTIF